MNNARLQQIATLIRRLIITATTEAGSGHPTSSLCAVELMTALMFAPAVARGPFFHFEANRPEHPGNDRLIFSKGHASPLFYALWATAGQVPFEDLLSFRKFDSPLEGHPMPRFPYTEAATGSLGQGLSIGLGMALGFKYLDKLPCRTFVLLGDSEMAEGSQWEAAQVAAHYKLDNLVGIMDVNRLGQRGETMFGHDIQTHAKMFEAFGWHTVLVEDGNDLEQVLRGYEQALALEGRPVMLVARTLKGAGVSEVQDKEGWHGKPLNREQMRTALDELGPAAQEVCHCLAPAYEARPQASGDPAQAAAPQYALGEQVATREAYGRALVRLAPAWPAMTVLDAEVGNSTMAAHFKEAYPERFFEMFVAEQNMAGAALGLSVRGKKPCASTFAAFWTRACDQIRMSRYSEGDILFCGSHAGVSIGEDGPSQMGLEDLAFFRTIADAAVFYPSDAMSCERLVQEALQHKGISYLRTTRGKTPVIYGPDESFPPGGAKVLRQSDEDRASIIAAGITLHEALAAADVMASQGVMIRVIDLYSIKPLDKETLARAARETGLLLTVEDHWAQGGLGEAVLAALADSPCPTHILAVREVPRSGSPQELLDHAGISRACILKTLQSLLS